MNVVKFVQIFYSMGDNYGVVTKHTPADVYFKVNSLG